MFLYFYWQINSKKYHLQIKITRLKFINERLTHSEDGSLNSPFIIVITI